MTDLRSRSALLTLVAALSATLSAVGCRSHGRAWDRAPLAPALSLSEAVAPGEVLVLLVDAHSGAPVGVSYAGVATLEPPAPAPSRWRERADSGGRARFRDVPAGAYELRVRALAYEDWHARVTVNERAGWVALVQLRRRPVHLETVIVREGAR